MSINLINSISFLTFVTGFLINCTPNMQKVSTKPVELSNNLVEVKMWPEAGGRIVWLGLKGLGNVLEFDSTIFERPAMRIPALSGTSDFMTLNGHIVWLGPQSTWWADQELNEKRKKNNVPWPPDPYLTYGGYQVSGNLSDHIKMVSPDSPVTGIQLEKEVLLTDSNIIHFKVKGTNIRNSPVSRDLWLNTRFNGWSRAYVPVADTAYVRVEDTSVPYDIIQGYFTYQPLEVTEKMGNSKAFINPSRPFIAGFTNTQLLIIEFESHNNSIIHPEHSLVEIYNHINPGDTSDALLELEYHAPFRTLQPGESMETWEKWSIYPYNGDATDEARIAYLQKLGF